MSFTKFFMLRDLLDDFDTDLQVFYHDVLLKELNFSSSSNAKSVRQALKHVVHAYKKGTVESNSSKILFDSSEKRCAYVLKHCPCFSSAVAKHFLQLLSRNTDIPNAFVHRTEINLCCLGGGPGTEAIAIVKIINILKQYDLLRNKEIQHESTGKIRIKVQIVDLSEEWKTTAEIILKAAQETRTLCDPEKMLITFELIEADLTKPLEEKTKRVLLDADIITMVYFVSAVNGSKSHSRCTSMLQNIMDLAKPGALLFFLDSAKERHYGAVMSAASKFKDMRQIYGPCLQEFHTLSMKSIKTYIELYFAQFNAILCLTNCFITCAGWIKVNFADSDWTDTTKSSEHTNFRLLNKRRQKNKQVEKNTRKQERYRQRVEKLLLLELNMNFVIEDLEECEYCPEPDHLSYYGTMFYATKKKRKRIVVGLEGKALNKLSSEMLTPG